MIIRNLVKKEIKERIEELEEAQQERFNPYREKNIEQLKELKNDTQ